VTLLAGLFPDPHDQVDQLAQTEEETDSGVDAVEDGLIGF